MNDYLRKEVKLLKALQGISYKEIAEEYLEVSYKGFLNWLNGQYEYGADKRKDLEEIVKNLTLPMD